MKTFVIENINDNSKIEIISMNIDKENNILTKQDNSLELISLEKFKDMLWGTQGGNNMIEPTHRIVKD